MTGEPCSPGGPGPVPGPPTTSVHPLELPSQVEPDALEGDLLTPPYPCPAHFRHSGWWRRRTATYAALRDTGASTSQLRRFARCGSGFWVLRSNDDLTRYKLALDLCRHRWCVPCARARAATITANLLPYIATRTVRFITLTLRHRHEPLARTVERLYRSFAALRRTAAWRRCVTGGMAFFEVVRSANDGCWHAHFHIIAEGRYFPHTDLKDAWHRVTGDSYIVDIRPVRSRHQAAHYVLKYTTKPCNVDPVSQDQHFRELITATASLRTIVAFGTWHRLRLLTPPSTQGWHLYCHADELLKKGIVLIVRILDLDWVRSLAPLMSRVISLKFLLSAARCIQNDASNYQRKDNYEKDKVDHKLLQISAGH